MATVEQLEAILNQIYANTEELLNRIVINASQIHVQELSAITANLGLAVAGEFRSGTGETKDDTFKGVRIGSPGWTVGGVRYAITGWNAGTFNFGLSAEDGTITAAGSMQSTNFFSGTSGWRIDAAGKAEFQDVVVRGTIESSILKYGEIQAVGGNILLTKSSFVIYSIFSIASLVTSFGLFVRNDGQAVAVNDILRIKTIDVDVWLKVTSVVNHTTYLELGVLYQSGSTSGVVEAGGAVVNYGPSTSGVIELAATATNSPRIDIGLTGSTPWTSPTQRVRLGNLNGSYGESTDKFGVGIGDYSGNNYIKYDGTTFSFVAGSGAVIIDDDGMRIVCTTSYRDSSALQFVDDVDGSVVFQTRVKANFGGQDSILLLNDSISPPTSLQYLLSLASSSYTIVSFQAYSSTTATGPKLVLEGYSTSTSDLLTLESNGNAEIKVDGDINIGDTSAGFANSFNINALDITMDGDLSGSSFDGWIKHPVTWTRTANTTFTLSGNYVSIFPVGTKLKVTDTTTKYFYVVSASYSSPNTTVTITGGSDYVLAANPTARYFSYEANPQGFPTRFNYTPSWTASVTNPTIGNGTMTGYFWMNGRTIHQFAQIDMGSTTTYGTGNYRIAQAITTSSIRFTGVLYMLDSNVATPYIGLCQVSGTDFVLVGNGINIAPTAPFTWASGDRLILQITYQI